MKRLIPLLLLILLPGLALASSPCILTVRVLNASSEPLHTLVTYSDTRTGWTQAKFTDKRGVVRFNAITPARGSHQTVFLSTQEATQIYMQSVCAQTP